MLPCGAGVCRCRLGGQVVRVRVGHFNLDWPDPVETCALVVVLRAETENEVVDECIQEHADPDTSCALLGL